MKYIDEICQDIKDNPVNWIPQTNGIKSKDFTIYNMSGNLFTNTTLIYNGEAVLKPSFVDNIRLQKAIEYYLEHAPMEFIKRTYF